MSYLTALPIGHPANERQSPALELGALSDVKVFTQKILPWKLEALENQMLCKVALPSRKLESNGKF